MHVFEHLSTHRSPIFAAGIEASTVQPIRSGFSTAQDQQFLLSGIFSRAIRIFLKNSCLILNQDMNDTSKELYNAARFGEVEKVRQLLKDPMVNINYQGASGRTVLHLAAQKGHVDLLKYLLRKGADPNVRNLKGLTPQDYAEDEVTRAAFQQYSTSKGNL